MKHTFAMVLFLGNAVFWLISVFVGIFNSPNDKYEFLMRAFLVLFCFAVYEILRILNVKN